MPKPHRGQKRRKKANFGALLQPFGEIFLELAVQKEARMLEGHRVPDQSNVVDWIKGKSDIGRKVTANLFL